MLVVENNSVYEIDEECLKRRSVPEECEVYKKIVREREVAKNKEKTEKPKKMTKNHPDREVWVVYRSGEL